MKLIVLPNLTMHYDDYDMSIIVINPSQIVCIEELDVEELTAGHIEGISPKEGYPEWFFPDRYFPVHFISRISLSSGKLIYSTFSVDDIMNEIEKEGDI